MTSAYDILREAAELNRQRNAMYGDNYKKFGHVAAALIPEGVTLNTPDDFNRFHLLVQMLVKITRYIENWDRGGHADSLRDLSVYSAMLESYDAERGERLGNAASGEGDDGSGWVYVRGDGQGPVAPGSPAGSETPEA